LPEGAGPKKITVRAGQRELPAEVATNGRELRAALAEPLVLGPDQAIGVQIKLW